MDRERGNGQRTRKWTENEEIKRKWREYEESERKWRESEEMESARQNEREKEFHLCISLSLLQNIKISHFFVTKH